MTKEQIEQAAKEYAETKTMPEAGYILTSRNAFIAGAQSRQSEIDQMTEKLKEVALNAFCFGGLCEDISFQSKEDRFCCFVEICEKRDLFLRKLMKL